MVVELIGLNENDKQNQTRSFDVVRQAAACSSKTYRSVLQADHTKARTTQVETSRVATMTNRETMPGLLLRTPFGDLHMPVDEQVQYPDGFFVWISANWHLYKAFVKRAREHKAHGRERYGAKRICEQIRWDTRERQEGEPEFKVNNNYVSGLSRLAQKQHDDLRGFFVCRSPQGFDTTQAA